jgi:hypothetical protein
MVLKIEMHEAFPPPDVEAARRAALNYDESAEVIATYATKAVEPVLVLLLFIGAQFGSGFFGKAGEDAWDALRGLVGRLRTDLQTQSQMVIEDDEGLQLILGPATPAEALADLPADIREAAGELGMLIWDEEAGAWKSPY